MLSTTSTTTFTPRSGELLLIGSAGVDPHSTIIVDPNTGTSVWSYKGSELQGASSGLVENLGEHGDHIVVSVKDRPLIHFIGVHARDRFHQKAVVSGPVAALTTSRKGDVILAAIRKQLFIWNLTTGELLSVIDAHYQDVTHIGLSQDESLVVTASSDGSIHAYLFNELVSIDREQVVAPLCKWNVHKLAVRGLQVTGGLNPRVVSCGLDHVACVHSVSADSTLLKVSSDRPLTSCCVDHAETRIFLGTDIGNIAQVDIYKVREREVLIQTSDEENRKFQVFCGHSEEITRLCVNADGCLLASGDTGGRYCVWDISSRQCLRVSNMRSSIASLRFVPHWPVLTSVDYLPNSVVRPSANLKRDCTKFDNITIDISSNLNPERDMWRTKINHDVDQLIFELSTGIETIEPSTEEKPENSAMSAPSDINEEVNEEIPTVGNKRKKQKNRQQQNGNVVNTVPNPVESLSKEIEVLPSGSTDEEIQRLRQEIVRLKGINNRLFDFASSEIFKGESPD